MKPEDKPIGTGVESLKPTDSAPTSAQPPKPEPQKDKKPSALQKALKQAGLAALFLLLGMLVILLILYLPAASKLREAQSELDRLIPIETQYLELEKSQRSTQAKALVYKLMSNTSLLEQALKANASERVEQQVAYIEEDLKKLELVDYPDLPGSLISKFTKVTAGIQSKSSTIQAAVQEFYNDLLRLSDNL